MLSEKDTHTLMHTHMYAHTYTYIHTHKLFGKVFSINQMCASLWPGLKLSYKPSLTTMYLVCKMYHMHVVSSLGLATLKLLHYTHLQLVRHQPIVDISLSIIGT